MWLLHQHFPTLASMAGMILAFAFIIWPPIKNGPEDRRRQARLAELASGAEESYFEERRSLEAYGPRSPALYRALGTLLFILCGAMLFLLQGG